MPSKSLISFLLAAVGLLSIEKKRSKWISCSGVTRERFRFSLSHFAPTPLMDFDLCGPDEGTLLESGSLLSDNEAELGRTVPTLSGD
jgi:hypothetical protein